MVRYADPAVARADAFLYDMGLDDIPGDLESPRVIAWFEAARNDVRTVAERGIYQDIEYHGGGLLDGDPDPLCHVGIFSFTRTPKPEGPAPDWTGRSYSILAMRTDRGYINKVRYDCPVSTGVPGLEVFPRFISEWTASIRQAPD